MRAYLPWRAGFVKPVWPSLTVRHPRHMRVLLALLSVYLVWGSTYLAVRFAIESYPPFMMSGLRYSAVAAILFVYLYMRGKPLPTRAQALNAMIIGALMLGAGTGGVAYAEQWVASGLAALAIAAMPLWAALFAGLWGRWPGRFEWGGLALGLFGVALLNMENGMQANPQGAVALLLAPMGWAFASMWSRRLALPGGFTLIAFQSLGGALVLMVASVVAGERLGEAPSLDSTLAVFYLTTFGSILAFTAYMYLLGAVRPALATSYAYVNPVVAVILGALFAGERITWLGVVAMVIILTGVALVAAARDTRPESKSVPPVPSAVGK